MEVKMKFSQANTTNIFTCVTSVDRERKSKRIVSFMRLIKKSGMRKITTQS